SQHPARENTAEIVAANPFAQRNSRQLDSPPPRPIPRPQPAPSVLPTRFPCPVAQASACARVYSIEVSLISRKSIPRLLCPQSLRSLCLFLCALCVNSCSFFFLFTPNA